MLKNNRKRLIAYLSMMLILLSLLNNRGENVTIEEYNSKQESSGTDFLYKEGNVYICSSLRYGIELGNVCKDSDIIVIDQSDYNDPNMKILSSYKITDVEDMKHILEIIKKYCESKETSWDRSIESMQNEWIIHNICSSLLIRNDRTDDVDLNNSDEIIYKSKILTKILQN